MYYLEVENTEDKDVTLFKFQSLEEATKYIEHYVTTDFTMTGKPEYPEDDYTLVAVVSTVSLMRERVWDGLNVNFPADYPSLTEFKKKWVEEYWKDTYFDQAASRFIRLGSKEAQEMREKNIATAFLAIASANHYMVGFTGGATLEELEKAKQILIVWDNNAKTKLEKEQTDLALDLIEKEIKGAKL